MKAANWDSVANISHGWFGANSHKPEEKRGEGKGEEKNPPLELAAFGKHFCKQAQGEEWQWKEQMFNDCSVT